MNRRVVRVLLLLYPKAWRERYGEELGTLCQELVERGEATRLRLAVGLALSAFVEHLRCALVAATLRRRSFTRFVAGVLAAAATAMVLVSTAVFGPLAPAGAVTLCEPHITHVGTVPPGQDPDVTITGTCFGTGGAFNGFSDHFGITDLGPRGTLGELENVALAQPTWWDACAATTDANKGVSLSVVSCSVPAWTNTSITFKSFGGEYGASHWVVDAGDKVVVQVWNANAPVSASWCLVPVVAKGAPGPGTTCASVLVAGQPVVNGGSTALHVRADQFGPGHKLLPAPWGYGQCQYQWFINDSMQAEIAVYKANCAQADAVGLGAYQAMGAPFHADGFACSAVGEGAGSPWASAWLGTYYAYNCNSPSAQVAFNWGQHYDTCGDSAAGGGVEASGGGVSPCPGAGLFGPHHTLLPSPLGHDQCEYQFVNGSVQAQIAVSEANCAQADALGIKAYEAKGGPFAADGFNCKARAEGAGSEWASAWSGTYYAYNCKAGLVQVAFNWGEHHAG